MEIYLTFDDGIQEGTEEVLAVLKETNVRATFFLVGTQLSYAIKKDRTLLQTLLKEIYIHHTIGNHSYSHANDCYADYYTNNGIRIDDNGNRRSILLDFEKSKDTINQLLYDMQEIDTASCVYPLALTQKMPLARLPGRNTWYVSDPQQPEGSTQALIRHFETDSRKGAEELYRAGYNVFGWNTEWRMTFDFHHDASSNIDRYAPENIWKDRPTETWKQVRDKMLKTGIGNKVILLMHERAFRKGTDKKETEQLSALINYFKETGAAFKSLDEYTSSPFQFLNSK
ncbi:polysaccharide deacetylase family protein [Chitinophaga sancti]|uniref:polysaccharide deacetylase family protein n=1 Tax=Chitinophaga sancti TaxID=1004 RepID=UPI003F7A493B